MGNRQLLRMSGNTQVSANTHGLAGAQMSILSKEACPVCQEAGSTSMLRRQGFGDAWGKQRRDSRFTDGTIGRQWLLIPKANPDLEVSPPSSVCS